MKVAVLVASTSRRAGGLFYSVRSLARSTEAAGCKVSVFAVTDEHSSEDLAHWRGLDVRLFPRNGPVAFGYGAGMAASLDLSAADLVHTQGLWMYPSVVGLRWSRHSRRPLIISPRGMLDPWAVRNSAWKKRLAGLFFEHAHLRQAACLHALCLSEYQAIRAYGLRNPIAIIPNGIDLPDSSNCGASGEGMPDSPLADRTLLFLSRIHRKKGLPNLLRAWAAVRRTHRALAERWRLNIAGWDDGGHLGELQQLVERLALRNSVQFLGPLFAQKKAAVLAAADAFVLPSMSEGLPMAVLEAWSHGLPVIITPGCNLPEGTEVNAALEIEPTVEAMSVALIQLFAMSDGARRDMGERGRKLVEQRFAWRRIADEMCAVYRWVSGRGARPDCVVTD